MERRPGPGQGYRIERATLGGSGGGRGQMAQSLFLGSKCFRHSWCLSLLPAEAVNTNKERWVRLKPLQVKNAALGLGGNTAPLPVSVSHCRRLTAVAGGHCDPTATATPRPLRPAPAAQLPHGPVQGSASRLSGPLLPSSSGRGVGKEDALLLRGSQENWSRLLFHHPLPSHTKMFCSGIRSH